MFVDGKDVSTRKCTDVAFSMGVHSISLHGNNIKIKSKAPEEELT